MRGPACVVCTAEILPVWVSHRLRLPSVSPMMTRWPHAAMAVATPSDELDMRPHDGRFGFVSVTCNPYKSQHLHRRAWKEQDSLGLRCLQLGHHQVQSTFPGKARAQHFQVLKHSGP